LRWPSSDPAEPWRRRRSGRLGSRAGRTADDHAVAILANVQDGPSDQQASLSQAEGVGLFRTELAFLNRETEPTVDEQADLCAEVLGAFAGRKVVVRTLDAGSDKPLAFTGATDEPNPAVGVRGMRLARTDWKSTFTNVSKELLSLCLDTDGDRQCDTREFLFNRDVAEYFWSYTNNGLKLLEEVGGAGDDLQPVLAAQLALAGRSRHRRRHRRRRRRRDGRNIRPRPRHGR